MSERAPCGCEDDSYRQIRDEACAFPEAVKLLKYIAQIGRMEVTKSGKTNLPQFGIEAFLAKVDQP